MNTLDQNTINRYSAGGDVYAAIVQQYGQAGADQIAAAAQTGDGAQLANAIELVRGNGQALNTSTADILANQLATDPLSAPLGAANTVLGNSLVALLKSPAVLFVIGLALFFFFGGADFIKRKLASK